MPQGTLEFMDDVVTPKFIQKQKDGHAVFNPMLKETRAYVASGEGYFLKSKSISCTTTGWKAEYDAKGPWLRHFLPSETWEGHTVPTMYTALASGDFSRVATEVSTSVLNKRGRSDSNLWETMAEASKTLGMLSQPLQKAFRWHKAFEQALSRDRAGRFTAKSFSNAWLAYRYGIRPVISDIENVLKALKTAAGKQRKTTRAQSTIRSTAAFSGSGTLGVLVQPYTVTVEDYYTVRGMSLDDVDWNFFEDLGFTSKGLATLPWELVRYSFVVDWAVNLGDFLGALVPAVGWKMLGSCLVADRVTTCVYNAGNTVLNSSSYELVRPISGTVAVTRHSKQRSVGLSAPGITVKSDFRLDDPTRIVDAATLLAQRFKKTLGNVAPR